MFLHVAAEAVQSAIAQAVTLPNHAFHARVAACRQAAEQELWRWRRATRDPPWHWKRALQAQFLCIVHESNSEAMLQLRRDAREAYHVLLAQD